MTSCPVFRHSAESLNVLDRQKILRLVVKESPGQRGHFDNKTFNSDHPTFPNPKVPHLTHRDRRMCQVIYCVGGVTTPPCGVPFSDESGYHLSNCTVSLSHLSMYNFTPFAGPYASSPPASTDHDRYCRKAFDIESKTQSYRQHRWRATLRSQSADFPGRTHKSPDESVLQDRLQYRLTTVWAMRVRYRRYP